MSSPAPADRHRPLLQRGRWFADLPAQRQQQLLALARPLRLAAGAPLFLRGDANAGLYAVLSGAVRIGAVGAGDRDAMLALLQPADWFGEIAFFDQGPRTHDAHAQGATQLLLVPRAVMAQLLQDDPLWWQHLGRLMAEKLRALFIGLEDLSLLPAPQRVARRLLAMADGHGMLAPGLAGRRIQVSQEQLGAMLSLTRQTVSSVLSDLAARGLIARRYGTIDLLDLDGLAAVGRGG